MSPSGALMKIKKLKAELGKIKRDEDSMAATVSYYKLALNNTEKKRYQEKLKRLALVLDFKRMEKSRRTYGMRRRCFTILSTK